MPITNDPGFDALKTVISSQGGSRLATSNHALSWKYGGRKHLENLIANKHQKADKLFLMVICELH